MNIIILGKHGSGKTNLGDIAMNTIFRMDGDAKIHNLDPDRSIDTRGSGNSVHSVSVRPVEDDESIIGVIEEVMEDNDVVVVVNSTKFYEWFRSLEEK